MLYNVNQNYIIKSINGHGQVWNFKTIYKIMLEGDFMDMDEYFRWHNQAEHTLRSSYRDLKEGDYSWACFKAQQAAEFGLKALLKAFGISAVGHSLVKLSNELDKAGIERPEDYMKWARKLDRDYIQPRYPDAYPQGSPYEYYDEEDARLSIEYAQKILAFVEGYINEFGNGDKKGKKE